MQETKPLLLGIDSVADVNELLAKRYGTDVTRDDFGAESTFEKSLYVQGVAAETLSEIAPDFVLPEHAAEIMEKANLEHVSADRIREIEAKTKHDVIAINRSLEEQLSKEAKPNVNALKTSADTTENAKALQLKKGIESLVFSIENLRDITVEKAVKWINIPFMDTTHLYDALPTVAGRPLVHYVETLQSDLDVMKFFYGFSTRGKWGDAVGNHHAATAAGIDGIKLQEAYCKKLGIGHMTAPAQIPAREFIADIVYSVARTAETLNNLAFYIALCKGQDFDVFIDRNPKKRKGSSAMPHKDQRGGNPTAEEQTRALANYTRGVLMATMCSCFFIYGRDLAASSVDRINLEGLFKFTDHVTRRMSNVVYHLGINQERSIERVKRTYGIVTSAQVMTYLVDRRRCKNPMARSQAHDLMGKLATEAYNTKTQFVDILLRNPEVTSRLDEQTLRNITNPVEYIGKSKEIIQLVKDKCYQKKTLEVA